MKTPSIYVVIKNYRVGYCCEQQYIAWYFSEREADNRATELETDSSGWFSVMEVAGQETP